MNSKINSANITKVEKHQENDESESDESESEDSQVKDMRASFVRL